MDETKINITYIVHVYNEKQIFTPIPDHTYQSVCIVDIVYDEPIIADSVSDQLYRQKIGAAQTKFKRT